HRLNAVFTRTPVEASARCRRATLRPYAHILHSILPPSGSDRPQPRSGWELHPGLSAASAPCRPVEGPSARATALGPGDLLEETRRRPGEPRRVGEAARDQHRSFEGHDEEARLVDRRAGEAQLAARPPLLDDAREPPLVGDEELVEVALHRLGER